MIDKKRQSDIISRMYNGDYLVKGVGGYFWANTKQKGCLIETADTDDVAFIINSANTGTNGIIKKTKRMRNAD